MTWNAQRVFPVPYQWRRVVDGRRRRRRADRARQGARRRRWRVAIALVVVYPLVLLAAAGFYLPAERARLRGLLPT